VTVDQHPTGRRFRVVPPLPADQLCLDLPGVPSVAEVVALAVARRAAVAGAAAAHGRGAGERPRAGRLVPTRDLDNTGGPPVAARVPAAVWAVWDGEDLVGVYAEESTARADAAVLRRDAARAGCGRRSWIACRRRRTTPRLAGG